MGMGLFPHLGEQPNKLRMMWIVHFENRAEMCVSTPKKSPRWMGKITPVEAIFLWVNAVGGSFDNAFANGGRPNVSACW